MFADSILGVAEFILLVGERDVLGCGLVVATRASGPVDRWTDDLIALISLGGLA